MYSYEHPHPAVTTDAVVFSIRDAALSVLLIRRGKEPFKGCWAFPGGFVDIDEDLDGAVYRELAEETGITEVHLHQFQAFGAPDRDPRERIITVAYLGLAPYEDLLPQAGDDAADVAWHQVDAVPELASDHGDILATALLALRQKIETTDIAMGMMPDQFTLSDLRQVYEVIMGESLDADVFRDWVLAQGWIEQTGKYSEPAA